MALKDKLCESAFELAHTCWQEIGGPAFRRRYNSGPDDSFYRSGYWAVVRQAVFDRDGFRCQRCGADAEQVHHLNYNFVGEDHLHPESLVSVCLGCHPLVEYARLAESLIAKINRRIVLCLRYMSDVDICSEQRLAHDLSRLLEYRDVLSGNDSNYRAGIGRSEEAIGPVVKRPEEYFMAASDLLRSWPGHYVEKGYRLIELLECERAHVKDFVRMALGPISMEVEKGACPSTLPRLATLVNRLRANGFRSTVLGAVGTCPRCGSSVIETESSYLCEGLRMNAGLCTFRVPKIILRRPLERGQIQKLLQTGRTDLLEDFTSNTGRAFPAFLVMDDSGKVTFEFPPREEQQPAQH